jgi:hypothetical protein
MTSRSVQYKSGYKYQLYDTVCVRVAIWPDKTIETDYITLTHQGDLFVKKGYAWDGPSGPTIDTKTFMRGALIHDALYQLMREGFLGGDCRKRADEELRRICLEDGMCQFRACWVYWAVRLAAGPATSYRHEREVKIAPGNDLF